MDFQYYQEQASKTAVYKNQGTFEGILYTMLGLANQTGQAVGKLKKVLRGDYDFNEDTKQKVVDELGDVMWYMAMAATELGVSLEQICYGNLEKLRDRAERGKIKGDGDKR